MRVLKELTPAFSILICGPNEVWEFGDEKYAIIRKIYKLQARPTIPEN